MTARKPGAVPPRPWTESDTEQMHALCAAGLSSVEIGQRLGRTTGAVAARRRVLGLQQTQDRKNANISRALIEKVPLAKRQAIGRKAGSSGWTPERRAAEAKRMRDMAIYKIGHQHITPAVVAKRVAKRSENLFPWCPPQYLELRTYLTRIKKMTRAEAEAIVRDTMAQDAAKAAAAAAKRLADEAARNGWSVAFQAQLERVQRGELQVVANRKLNPADHDFSLTGSTAAMAMG